MLVVNILAGIAVWLILGVLTVALAEATSLVEELTGDACNSVCTLLLWPLAVLILVLVFLTKIGRIVGEWLQP